MEEVQVLWSRVDAQRTMIAMGEKVRAPMHCNEEKEKRRMLSEMTILEIVRSHSRECLEGNGLGKRGRVVGNKAEGKIGML